MKMYNGIPHSNNGKPLIKPLRIFEVEFYDTSKRIILAENRQAIRNKYPGDVYMITRIEIT